MEIIAKLFATFICWVQVICMCVCVWVLNVELKWTKRCIKIMLWHINYAFFWNVCCRLVFFCSAFCYITICFLIRHPAKKATIPYCSHITRILCVHTMCKRYLMCMCNFAAFSQPLSTPFKSQSFVFCNCFSLLLHRLFTVITWLTAVGAV